MALQSVWYYTNLPEDIVEIIEKDISNNFDDQMADSRLHGDALNKDKRNSQNAWIPTDHWLGGFMWHYVQRANRENFLYDLRGIDAESMQYTKYEEGMFYGWHNDAGLSTQYKPVSNNNRSEGLHQDWVNENRKIVRMYFINDIPFTWDELEDIGITPKEIPGLKIIADNQKEYNVEDLYNYHSYIFLIFLA